MPELLFPTPTPKGPNMRHGTLELPRCPHCSIDRPNLVFVWDTVTKASNLNEQRWRAFACNRCGGVVFARGNNQEAEAEAVFPTSTTWSEAIPATAREYLRQAVDSLHSPVAAVIVAATAVDAMLKAHGYKQGTLYERIGEAAEAHLITEGMAKWAHQVRLDANGQRHADEELQLPSVADAQRSIDFALALAEFLFVLPARVSRGLSASLGSGT